MLRAAWLGEIGKLALTALLFAVVFVSVRPLSAIAVFGGFIAAQLMVFGLPLIGSGWFDSKDGNAKS
jgi:ATP synthase protein I